MDAMDYRADAWMYHTLPHKAYCPSCKLNTMTVEEFNRREAEKMKDVEKPKAYVKKKVW